MMLGYVDVPTGIRSSLRPAISMTALSQCLVWSTGCFSVQLSALDQPCSHVYSGRNPADWLQELILKRAPGAPLLGMHDFRAQCAPAATVAEEE